MGRGGGGGGGHSAGSTRSSFSTSSRSSSSSHSSSSSRASFSSGRSRGYSSSSNSSGSRSSYRSSSGSSRVEPPYEGPRRTGGMWGHIPMFGFRPRARYYGGSYYGGGYGGGYNDGYYGAPYRRGGCGCLSGTVMLVLVLLIFVFAVPAACMSSMPGSSHTQTTQNTSGVVFSLNNENSGSNTSSARQKLPAADCMESEQWIDDQANWIENQNTVVAKMRSFYEKTGVQPYLIIADQVNGKKDYTEADVERYLRNRYDELFEDDGHLILFFCEAYENEYDPYLLVGSKAATVVDQSAENLIYEAIDRWYTDSSLDDDAYFARIFLASGDAIMNGTDFSEFD